ncbi:hypothetical protein NDU88_007096 [Pleurodeles waltl]|uniref:Uncharacterized protein n=1 Tax=Pleurodeles waltl TaxID=8319 RepID=A0AAV7PK90_PLEWA|nr:hypothetical protein NDU88_007096 [Pleurodeles waltl]
MRAHQLDEVPIIFEDQLTELEEELKEAEVQAVPMDIPILLARSSDGSDSDPDLSTSQAHASTPAKAVHTPAKPSKRSNGGIRKQTKEQPRPSI